MTRFFSLLALTLVVAAIGPSVTLAQQPVPPCSEIRPCWWSDGSTATLERFEAHLEVTDGVLRANYALHLANPGDALAEGRIIVPVPRGSSVADLVLSGGPETLEGKLLDANEAERIYEDIIRRLIDPALLRSLGGDLFEVRAFPVPPAEERIVSFTVATPLTAVDEQALIEIPWSRMSPRPASAVVSADVDVSWELRSAFAPGRRLALDRTGDGQVEVSWESSDELDLATDFNLYLTGGEGLLSTKLLAHRIPGEDGYFAVLFAPTMDVDERVDRDIIFVLDVSGSMDGDKMEQAKRAASYVLDRLGDNDRFALVAFSRNVRVFGEGLHPTSDASDGQEFIDSLVAGGGTNISGALDSAFGLVKGERPATLIFLTDGLPTAGIQDPDEIMEEAISQAPERAQMFTFGVGSDVDTVLLDGLADEFVGTSHYVTGGEKIDGEVSRLYERISTPILTDIEVRISGGDTYDLAPAQIRGLFAGSQELLMGRYEEAGPLVVEVEGNTATGHEKFVYELILPESDMSDPTIAQLWAQRRVADLLTELRVEGPRDSLVEEIVDIATQFGIVTPYTSYLAEEPELAFDDDEAARIVTDSAAAPSSGATAVGGANALEKLRGGDFSAGAETVRVVGSQSYLLLDGVWTPSSYDGSSNAPEVLVGSDAFAALLESDPLLAAAASIGQRVVIAGETGWVTVVWPEPDDAGQSIIVPDVGTIDESSAGPNTGPVVSPQIPAQESGGGRDLPRWETALLVLGLLATATLATAVATNITRSRTTPV